MRTILSWLLSFKVFENILRGQTIKISLKMGHFSVFLCIGAKPFIIAHHGFHHSVGKGLKYLGYQGYIYAHSPLRGSQLSPKKPRKQYFSRLCQKVDFVGLFSRLSQIMFALQNPITKIVLSKAKMMRLVKYLQTPPSTNFYDHWNVLQHPNLYFSAIQRMWFLDASSHLYKRVCPSVRP